MNGEDLPPELWGLIITYLPSLDKRTCLSVPKLIHDLALPCVFSHLALRLGVLLPGERESRDGDAEKDLTTYCIT
ncbi:hypothetical protein BD309DRAFT_717068 [Dichomitus squalens]|uniref:Uncharacterized protein n=1 Tax=Dichomitus squalens TaxID=114155 RepID=A0A4Q9M9Z2_9APHY|nr:hypothetical protein BD311DRAFT_767504 [Dichomitus squalens]TBU45450.1 hypothetical protein BD309DRAFT_717068 [Dichomitus squalens]